MKTITFKKVRTALGSILVAASALNASAALILAPPESQTIHNGNASATPFDLAQPARFQQVYSASAFPSVASGGGWITEIRFRVDSGLGHPFSVTIPNIQINLSTTQLLPNGLSSSFDSNVGTDDTVVRGLGSLSISSLGGGGAAPFDFGFALSQPFFYDPANGNLLMDFRIYQGIGGPNQGSIAILDAFNNAGDSVSSVYGFGPSLPLSGQTSSLGLATLFVVTPVPEPSTLALLAVGLGMLGFGWKRLRKHKEGTNAAD